MKHLGGIELQEFIKPVDQPPIIAEVEAAGIAERRRPMQGNVDRLQQRLLDICHHMRLRQQVGRVRCKQENVAGHRPQRGEVSQPRRDLMHAARLSRPAAGADLVEFHDRNQIGLALDDIGNHVALGQQHGRRANVRTIDDERKRIIHGEGDDGASRMRGNVRCRKIVQDFSATVAKQARKSPDASGMLLASARLSMLRK